MPPAILLIEDDAVLRALLTRFLSEHQFAVTAVGTLGEAEKQRQQTRFAAIVLDLMLPDGDGTAFCRELRRDDNTPVLIHSARGDELERILGLELGADDYLPKPANPRELVARLRAILRRQQRALPPPSMVGFGDWRFDVTTQQLWQSDQPVALTTGERLILAALVAHPHVVRTREQLLLATHGNDWDADSRSVDVQIGRLRKRLEVRPNQPQFIQTVWGQGYRFVPTP